MSALEARETCRVVSNRAILAVQGKVVWVDHLPQILARLQEEGISLRRSRLREDKSERLQAIIEEITGKKKIGRNLVDGLERPYRGKAGAYQKALQDYGVIPKDAPFRSEDLKKSHLERLLPKLIASESISVAYWALHSNNTDELRELIFHTIGIDLGGASIVRAGKRLYGSWGQTLLAFGIDMEQDAGFRARVWGRAEVRKALQALHRRVPLNPGNLEFDDSEATSNLIFEALGFHATGRALYLAALARYESETELDRSAYWQALLDAGLDPERIYEVPASGVPR